MIFQLHQVQKTSNTFKNSNSRTQVPPQLSKKITVYIMYYTEFLNKLSSLLEQSISLKKQGVLTDKVNPQYSDHGPDSTRFMIK